jgi:hypothetical protein
MGLTRGGGAVIMAEEPHFRRRNRGLTRHAEDGLARNKYPDGVRVFIAIARA